MKKLLIILIILTGCVKAPVYKTDRNVPVTFQSANIVTTPANSGLGTPLRIAMDWIKNDFATTDALFGTIYTETQTKNVIADSNNARLAAALELGDYTFLKTEADQAGGAMTYEGVVNYVAANGGTGSGGYEWTEFIVGTTTGAPANATANLTVPAMAGDVMELYRGTDENMAKQFLNEGDTNTVDGYRYNSAGKMIVRPVWATGDRGYIKAVSSSAVTKVTLSGGASSLLTSLRAGWKKDETAGTAVNDVLGVYTGTTNATVAQAGKFGYSHSYTRSNSDVADFGATVGDVSTSDFSVACWVYIPDTAKLEMGIMGNGYGSTPYWYLETNEFNYTALFYWNFGSGAQELSSNAAIPQAVWTHIAVTVDRSGNALMYINGGVQTDVEDVSGDVAVAGDNNTPFNLGNIGNSAIGRFFNGGIDDVYIWRDKILSAGEVTELYTGTHPW